MSDHIKSNIKKVYTLIFHMLIFITKKLQIHKILHKFNQKKAMIHLSPLKTLNTIFTKREKISLSQTHTRAQKSTSKSSTNLEATKRKREARGGERERERKKSEREEKKVPQNVDIYIHISNI